MSEKENLQLLTGREPQMHNIVSAKAGQAMQHQQKQSGNSGLGRALIAKESHHS